jgi:hypothetical protein
MTIESPSIDLPGVAREYFAAANASDIDRTAALFAEEAYVTDEGNASTGAGPYTSGSGARCVSSR